MCDAPGQSVAHAQQRSSSNRSSEVWCRSFTYNRHISNRIRILLYGMFQKNLSPRPAIYCIYTATVRTQLQATSHRHICCSGTAACMGAYASPWVVPPSWRFSWGRNWRILVSGIAYRWGPSAGYKIKIQCNYYKYVGSVRIFSVVIFFTYCTDRDAVMLYCLQAGLFREIF